MKKPAGAKGADELPPLPKLPPHTYETRNNNPVWNLPLPVELTRMDNSLHLSQHVGDLKDSAGKEGDVSLALGGFVFVVTVRGKSGEESRRYGIDLSQAIEVVFMMDDQLRKPKRKPHPKSVVTVPARRKK